jgi:S-methylmethionine-dependent homocysteine/selenocysteine methylase
VHCAIEADNVAVFNVLMSDGGCNLELANCDGATPLWLALTKASNDDIENNVFACQLVTQGCSTNSVITSTGRPTL